MNRPSHFLRNTGCLGYICVWRSIVPHLQRISAEDRERTAAVNPREPRPWRRPKVVVFVHVGNSPGTAAILPYRVTLDCPQNETVCEWGSREFVRPLDPA